MRLNIAFRLSLLLASFGVLAAVLVGYFTFAAGRDMLRERAERSLLATTQILGQHMQAGFAGVARDTQLLAAVAVGRQVLVKDGIGTLAEHDRQDLADIFAAAMQAHPNYLQIRLISARDHGLELVRVDREGAQEVRVAQQDLQEKAHFPFVFEALRLSQGEVYVSEFGINHESGAVAQAQQPVFSMACPVVHAGQVVGVLVVRVAADQFLDFFKAGLPLSYGFFLANRWGDFLVHPQEDQAFGFDRGQRILVQDAYDPVAQLIDGRRSELVMDSIGAEGQSLVMAFTRMPFGRQDEGRFLVIGLSQPLAVVREEAVELGRNILKMLLVLSAIGVALAMLVSRVVTGPVQAMLRATQAFSRGDACGDLPVQRKDELGELARSFSDMGAHISRQMTELNASRDAMAHLAHHDTLTGLPNRRMFEQRLKPALVLSRRTGRSCALLFLDIDDFKAINDTLGHAFGDAVLQAVARTILSVVRESDIAARLAGDEFIVLSENVDTEDGARQIAGKLQDAFRNPIDVGGHPFRVYASIGLSLFPRDGQDAEALLESADAAMYRAKQGRSHRH